MLGMSAYSSVDVHGAPVEQAAALDAVAATTAVLSVAAYATVLHRA
jgi:hypothetical protein